MPQPRVLVSGAGVAGGALAFWLAKGGAQVTVIERASNLRTAGQGIDINGAGLEVVRRMGLEEAIRERTIGDKGLTFVDSENRIAAAFDVGENSKDDLGFTSEIEIMRGEVISVFYRAAAAMENVEFRFGCTARSLSQTEDSVVVEFTDGSKPETFDIVVAADGLGSRTRDLILNAEDRKTCVKSINQWVAYFSIPSEERDGPRSRWYSATGRRAIVLRPRNKEQTSAYLTVMKHSPQLKGAPGKSAEAQKAILAEAFADAGWEASRVIAGMRNSDDFHFQESAQIKLGKGGWSQGRCVLSGDAGYSPSPITGMGTTLAIVGAYVLAGEITKSPGDPGKAFMAYEDKLRDYVEKAQNIPLGGYVPLLVNPDTQLGIWILRTILWLVSSSGILKLLGGFGAPEEFDLPDYEFGKA